MVFNKKNSDSQLPLKLLSNFTSTKDGKTVFASPTFKPYVTIVKNIKINKNWNSKKGFVSKKII